MNGIDDEKKYAHFEVLDNHKTKVDRFPTTQNTRIKFCIFANFGLV